MLGPFKLIASFHGAWVVVVCLAVGLVLGSWLAYVGIAESLKVTLTDSEIRLDKEKTTHPVARRDVDAVFADGKKLVVLDRGSRQLVRTTSEVTRARLADAFRLHGYPWVEQDPYAELYERWVPDTPDLPAEVNALMSAREVALRKRVAKDAARLRDEVQKLGFVVREDGARQFFPAAGTPA
jgi:hypothetical protein